MAKAQGFEPRLAVLETAVLPLDHALKFDNKKAPTAFAIEAILNLFRCSMLTLRPPYISIIGQDDKYVNIQIEFF